MYFAAHGLCMWDVGLNTGRIERLMALSTRRSCEVLRFWCLCWRGLEYVTRNNLPVGLRRKLCPIFFGREWVGHSQIFGQIARVWLHSQVSFPSPIPSLQNRVAWTHGFLARNSQVSWQRLEDGTRHKNTCLWGYGGSHVEISFGGVSRT